MNRQEQQKLLPYLPKNRMIIYVNPDNKFIKKAAQMLAHSGCAKQPTAAVIVKNRKIIGCGVNTAKRIETCPRVVHNCPTGVGYKFCVAVCQQEGHCAIMAIRDALNQSNAPKGASIYLDGHWWVCKSCWDIIIKVGISRVFLRKNSIELYKR